MQHAFTTRKTVNRLARKQQHFNNNNNDNDNDNDTNNNICKSCGARTTKTRNKSIHRVRET